MTRIAALVLVFGTVALPLQASAFGVANAGVVHDVGAVEAWPAGLAVLPSSDTLMFGTMGAGDGWHWTLVVSRVAADGTIDWTHTGASRPWSAERVVGAPGDTAVVFGDDNADRNFPAYLARFDADGHELWNRPANLDSTVTTLAADASSIWVLDDDARISRFSLDGDVGLRPRLRRVRHACARDGCRLGRRRAGQRVVHELAAEYTGREGLAGRNAALAERGRGHRNAAAGALGVGCVGGVRPRP
jgi:hypothetical protein